MTIRTFWTILIKILGIWLVLDSVTVIPQFLSTIFFLDPNDSQQNFAMTAALLILTILIYLFVLRLFVFKTSWVIDILNLDKGFNDDKIDINVQLTTVLTISTIVIGGLMFVDGLPLLCKHTFMFFQDKFVFRESSTSEWVIFYLVKTILGYLLMTKSKQVIAFINKQSRNQNDSND